MNKTITVRIDRREQHPLYKKIITKSTKLHVHDAQEQAKLGDTVLIRPCRPHSKTVSWELLEVVAEKQ